jgi:glc operon protein GlcG
MRISVALGLVLAGLALPTQNVAAQFLEKKVLTLAAAQRMVAAAQAEAERNHWAGVIAVVDDGGWPILMVRMDNAAFVASVELAPGKARTAALFKKPSQALEDAINHGRIAAVTARGFIEMQGGLPIVVDGQVIGGIGASFDTPEHDVQVAKRDWPRSVSSWDSTAPRFILPALAPSSRQPVPVPAGAIVNRKSTLTLDAPAE